MLGAVFLGNREIELRDFPEPIAGPGEVVIAIGASGMCGSDLHYYRAEANAASGSKTDWIGGHEPAGTVVEVGPGAQPGHVLVGDRVMVHHYAGCGRCAHCRAGWAQMCERGNPVVYGKNQHGAHARYMKFAAAAALPLPEDLSFSAGAAIGCGTGTAWGALERIGDLGGKDLVVFGQGPVGQSVTLLAHARGARVICVDPSGERRAQALRLGAAEALDSGDKDVLGRIRELTGGSGASAAVETSGVSSAADLALESLAPWGKLCAVGLGSIVSLDVRRFLSRQLTVMTSWSLSSVQQIACADFIVRHGIDVEGLYTDQWRLEEAGAAYALFDQQSTGKGVFIFGSGQIGRTHGGNK